MGLLLCYAFIVAIDTYCPYWHNAYIKFSMLVFVEQFLKKESDSMPDVACFTFIALLGRREEKRSFETRESCNWGQRSSRKVNIIPFLSLDCTFEVKIDPF